MTQNKCCKCKFFIVADIKEYICRYKNCKLHGYNNRACDAFEKWSD